MRTSRCITAAIIALHVWLLTPVAWAQDCPQNTYTDAEAQKCLVCLHERESLHREAYKQAGELTESRRQNKTLRHELRDMTRKNATLTRRPTWWVVVGVGVAVFVFSGVGGYVAGR